MRFLRMLTNALLAGAFGSAYLTIIVLQLNPEVSLLSATPWWWFVTMWVFYGLQLAVLLYAIILAREFFTMNALTPGWVSVRLLAWLGAALSAAAAVLMWLNVRGFEPTLGEVAAWRMKAGAMATSVSTLVLLAIAAAHYSSGRRGSRVGAWLLVIAITASMALPVAARGGGVAPPPRASLPVLAGALVPEEHGPRVTLIALDGASLEHIWPRAAEGRLPNFSRVLEGGAVISLATTRPTQPDPIWAAVATGKYPDTTGVRSSARYHALGDGRGIDLLPDHCLSHALVRFGLVRAAPLRSGDWEAAPLWNILSSEGLTSGIVRWTLTHPAPPVAGFVVSDRTFRTAWSNDEFEQAVYPREALRTVQSMGSDAADSTDDDGEPLFEAGSPEAAAYERDRYYARIGRALNFTHTPRLFALRYTGLDTIGHYYQRYVQPGAARGVSEEDRRRYGAIVDRYYAFIDAELGIALNSLRDGDLLLVVAGFGIQPLNAAKKLVGRVLGDPDLSGTHERAPDGFLVAYGSAVQPGRPQRGAIVDVTPTILYFFGLPVGRDMDGYARSDLFTRDFTAERPVSFIPSYR
jgi:predicted AlkP superfamily phosphohydrolase/phosphomutase